MPAWGSESCTNVNAAAYQRPVEPGVGLLGRFPLAAALSSRAGVAAPPMSSPPTACMQPRARCFCVRVSRTGRRRGAERTERTGGGASARGVCQPLWLTLTRRVQAWETKRGRMKHAAARAPFLALRHLFSSLLHPSTRPLLGLASRNATPGGYASSRTEGSNGLVRWMRMGILASSGCWLAVSPSSAGSNSVGWLPDAGPPEQRRCRYASMRMLMGSCADARGLGSPLVHVHVRVRADPPAPISAYRQLRVGVACPPRVRLARMTSP